MKLLVQISLPIIFIFALGYAFYKHSGYFLYEHNSMQYMPNMHRTKELKPQRGYDFYPNGAGARVPPMGTIGRNQIFYAHKKEEAAVSIERKSNPLPITRDVVMRGQKMYMTYCVVCHGTVGLGNGYIVPPFVVPPSLHSEKVRGYADSQIFHIITVGQNNMPSYAPQIREADRWAIIHYVRVLQKSENPSEADLNAFDKAIGTESKP